MKLLGSPMEAFMISLLIRETIMQDDIIRGWIFYREPVSR